jgi:hypothetical protein
MRALARRKLALAMTSIVFALLIGEAAARWLLPVQYRLTQTHRPDPGAAPSPPIHVSDPQIGWVLSPQCIKSHHRGVGPNGSRLPDVIYSICHGERITSSQPQSGSVIVATGCSFTFGQGVNDQDTWPWLLQQLLPDDHVVNVAAMAYGTDQALLAAEREASRFPREVRTVVLGFGDFQIERNRCPQSWLSTLYPFGKPRFVLDDNKLQYKGLIKLWSLGSVVDNIVDHSILFSHIANLVVDRLVYRIDQHADARPLTVALITDFARRFQSRGIRLVAVVLPYSWDQVARSKADRSFVIAQLRAAGIPTLVLDIPRLPDGRFDFNRYLVGSHPNRQYNLLLANQLAQFLGALNASQGSVAHSRN